MSADLISELRRQDLAAELRRIDERDAGAQMRVAEKSGAVVDAVLALTAQIRGEPRVAMLAPGYRAVWLLDDGFFSTVPLVALIYEGESLTHIELRPAEGFAFKEMEPDWYLAPNEELTDEIQDAIRRRVAKEPR